MIVGHARLSGLTQKHNIFKSKSFFLVSLSCGQTLTEKKLLLPSMFVLIPVLSLVCLMIVSLCSKESLDLDSSVYLYVVYLPTVL